jgi:hypothetical protein
VAKKITGGIGGMQDEMPVISPPRTMIKVHAIIVTTSAGFGGPARHRET